MPPVSIPSIGRAVSPPPMLKPPGVGLDFGELSFRPPPTPWAGPGVPAATPRPTAWQPPPADRIRDAIRQMQSDQPYTNEEGVQVDPTKPYNAKNIPVVDDVLGTARWAANTVGEGLRAGAGKLMGAAPGYSYAATPGVAPTAQPPAAGVATGGSLGSGTSTNVGSGTPPPPAATAPAFQPDVPQELKRPFEWPVWSRTNTPGERLEGAVDLASIIPAARGGGMLLKGMRGGVASTAAPTAAAAAPASQVARVGLNVPFEAAGQRLGGGFGAWMGRNVVAPPVRMATGEGALSNTAQAVEGILRGGKTPIVKPLMRAVGYGTAPGMVGGLAATSDRPPDATDQVLQQSSQAYMPPGGDNLFERGAMLAGGVGAIGPANQVAQYKPGPDQNVLEKWWQLTQRRGENVLQAAKNFSTRPLEQASRNVAAQVQQPFGVGAEVDVGRQFEAYNQAQKAFYAARTPEEQATAQRAMDQAREAIATYRINPAGAAAEQHFRNTQQTTGEAAARRQIAATLPAGDPLRATLEQQAAQLEAEAKNMPVTAADRDRIGRATANPQFDATTRDQILRDAGQQSAGPETGAAAGPASIPPATDDSRESPASGLFGPGAVERFKQRVQAGQSPQAMAAEAQAAPAVDQGQPNLAAQGVQNVAQSLGTTPDLATSFWGSLGTGSKVLLGLGVSLAVLPSLFSLFGDDDNEEGRPGGMGFFGRVLPFLGLGMAAWGAAGGDFNKLPELGRFGQTDFWKGVGNDLGGLGDRAMSLVR